ncbi:MAG: helix-turn-helix domain-containing protein [Blastocatellia bacterium]
MLKNSMNINSNNKNSQNESFEVRDIRNQPWFWIDKIILNDYIEKIGAIGFLVYCTLVSYTGSSNKCWPSYSTLADKLKLGRSTVIKTIKILVEVGLIGIEKRQTQADGHISNVYVLLSVKPLGSAEQSSGPGSPQVPALVQEKYQPSPPNNTTLVSNVDQPSPPIRPYLYTHDQYTKEENKEEDTSLSLSDSSSTQAINFSSSDKKEEKESLKETSSKEKEAPNRNVSDNRAKHPAIAAVRAIVGRFPNKLLWDEIIDILGNSPDLEKLKRCATEWAKKTSNMGNMVWLFEWYKNGIPLSVYAANQIKETQSQQTKSEKPIRGKAAFDIAAQRFLERKAREAKENEGQQHL